MHIYNAPSNMAESTYAFTSMVAADDRGLSLSGWGRISGEPRMVQDVAQSWLLRPIRMRV